MGVTYKLTDEVVNFIVSQRRSNPLLSCRQLAESASQKFSLNLSKSSVHDVLREAGIITPRGRKPKDKFAIPVEKKQQIQVSLSQVKLLPSPEQKERPKEILGPIVPSEDDKQSPEAAEPGILALPSSEEQEDQPKEISEPIVPSEDAKNAPEARETIMLAMPPTKKQEDELKEMPEPIVPSEDTKQNHEAAETNMLALRPSLNIIAVPPKEDPKEKQDPKISEEYEGAGRIFLKAALWDLGIFSDENLKDSDWEYYLTYARGVKVALENNKDFFIELPLPIERCIRETADGLINNVRPFIVNNIKEEGLFKACMEAKPGFKIEKISIVDQNDHVLLDILSIVEFNRSFIIKNINFVENSNKDLLERAKALFFSEDADSKLIIEDIIKLKGFDTTSKEENIVTLLVSEGYDNNNTLQEAVEKINAMYLRDEHDRLIKIKIQASPTLSFKKEDESTSS